MIRQSVIRKTRGGNSQRGSMLFDFTISALVLLALLFGVIEISRLALVANAIANSARAGVRFAIVHGANAGTPQSSGSHANVDTAVKNFAGAAPLNTSSVAVTVTYVDGTNTPGSRVEVKVTYAYDPFMTYYALNTVHLGSVSRGVIVF